MYSQVVSPNKMVNRLKLQEKHTEKLLDHPAIDPFIHLRIIFLMFLVHYISRTQFKSKYARETTSISHFFSLTISHCYIINDKPAENKKRHFKILTTYKLCEKA
jgi:hypothetical protein